MKFAVSDSTGYGLKTGDNGARAGNGRVELARFLYRSHASKELRFAVTLGFSIARGQSTFAAVRVL